MSERNQQQKYVNATSHNTREKLIPEKWSESSECCLKFVLDRRDLRDLRDLLDTCLDSPSTIVLTAIISWFRMRKQGKWLWNPKTKW